MGISFLTHFLPPCCCTEAIFFLPACLPRPALHQLVRQKEASLSPRTGSLALPVAKTRSRAGEADSYTATLQDHLPCTDYCTIAIEQAFGGYAAPCVHRARKTTERISKSLHKWILVSKSSDVRMCIHSRTSHLPTSTLRHQSLHGFSLTKDTATHRHIYPVPFTHSAQ